MKRRKLATAVSLVLAPQLYGGFASYLVWLHKAVGGAEALASLLISQTVLPLAWVLLDAARGRVDIFVSDRSIRLKYYVLTLASYALGAVWAVVRDWDAYLPLYAAYAAVVAALAVVNELARWKISAHAAGIAAPTTVLVLAVNPWYLLLYFLLLPVAWARLELEAHTPGQLAAGAIVAAVATLLVLRLMGAAA
uniref:Phosphatase PAP2 family protein n=1 Tax=Thermofilum pendens TaxID=2269 RepID=A0A7J3X4Z5_THEPE